MSLQNLASKGGEGPTNPYPKRMELYCRLDRPVLYSIISSAFDSTALGRINASFSKRGTTRLRLPPFPTVFFYTTFYFFFFKVLFFDVRSPRTHCVCLYVGECTIVFFAHTKKQRSSSAPIIPRVPTRPGCQWHGLRPRVACPPNVFVLLQ